MSVSWIVPYILSTFSSLGRTEVVNWEMEKFYQLISVSEWGGADLSMVVVVVVVRLMVVMRLTLRLMIIRILGETVVVHWKMEGLH